MVEKTSVIAKTSHKASTKEMMKNIIGWWKKSEY